MKFNYDLYRPKKFIQDAWKSNSSYFRSKDVGDVGVTPHTKIGDADEVYKARSTGRFPALAKRLKPNRLTLSEILPRSRKVLVRSVDHQESVNVSVDTPYNKFTKRLGTTRGQVSQRFAATLDTARKNPAATSHKSLLARSAPVLSYLLLGVVMIGIGAGSVYAYVRPHTPRPDSLQQSGQRTEVKGESTTAQKGTQETPPTTPDPPATSAPADQAAPQSTTPTSNAETSPPDNPQTIVNNTKDNTTPVPAPQNTASVTLPAPAAPTPSTPDPSTVPTSPPQPTTPPSNETDTPKTPDENQQSTNTSTNIDIREGPTTPPAQVDKSVPIPGNKSSAQ